MKKYFPIIKKVLLLCSLAIVFIGIIFILIAANNYQDRIPFKKLHIEIDHHRQIFFVKNEDVNNLFYVLFKDSVKLNSSNVNLRFFEQQLEKNPFVKQAEVYSDMKGNVFVSIVQKEPLLRIINNSGVSYYLDINGEKLPLSNNFTPRVTVATGYIETNKNFNTDSIKLKQLFDIATFIRKDKFLWALCEQIDVSEQGEIEIIPKTGKYRFIIGDAKDLEGKFKRMKVFYTEILSNDTVQYNNTVNLKYNNQIICTKSI